MTAPSNEEARPDLEWKKFVKGKKGETLIGNHAFGTTSGGDIIPLKVEDDGSGYGKLVCSIE